MSGPVGPQEKEGIWIISVIGASIRKLRDDAWDASISPDGSKIVFRDVENHHIWIMGADGEQPKELIKPEEGYHLGKPTWFPDGRRIAYVKWHVEKGRLTLLVESRNADGNDPVTLISNAQLVDFAWRGSDRMLYVVGEAPPNQYDSNIWELRFDPQTGKPRSAPRQLTDWTGFNFQNPELTADGKRLVFLNTHAQSDVYVGELAGGNSELKAPRRFTLDERLDWPGGWSSDSKSLVIYSDRNGNFDIYRQNLDSTNAEPIATGPEEKWAPQITADGKWVVFMAWPKSGDIANSGKLMRVPVSGGPAEFIMNIKGHPGIVSSNDPSETAGGFPSFRCPRQGTSCILAEREDRKQIVFTAFDPVQGKKAQVATVPRRPDRPAMWDVAPDGSRIAVSSYEENAGDIQILPLSSGEPKKISVKNWNRFSAIAWAADGRSLFAASFSSRGTSVVHVSLNGDAIELFKPVWDIFSLSPSPDGRSLAIGAIVTNANAWTIPNLPK
ncbi:MAG TPA: hypothetical protein VE994_02400 [Terriglobales bacterium]|nr:hypothetical protein [Terriglobales bacterium]